MKILVNLFHPNLAESRINRRWRDALLAHPEITLNDQYAAYPAWQIDVAREQELLLGHDRIVFQFPFYWYSCPPLMKKWLDDVLTYGWAYGSGGTKLKDKEWVCATSVGGPEHAYQAGGFNFYALSELLKPFQQTANLIGMTYLPIFKLHGVVWVSDAELEESASAYIAHITNPELNPAVRLKHLLSEMEKAGTVLKS